MPTSRGPVPIAVCRPKPVVVLEDGIHVGDYTRNSVCKMGSGGAAHVMSVRHNRTGLNFALKAVPSDRTEEIDQLYNEAIILQYLHHPCIVRLTQILQSGKAHYLVLEHLKYNLNRFISQEYPGSLPESVARRIFQQLVAAVHYCHKQHIVHSDIRCENVCVDHSGNVRLIDFGRAIMFDPESNDIIPLGVDETQNNHFLHSSNIATLSKEHPLWVYQHGHSVTGGTQNAHHHHGSGSHQHHQQQQHHGGNVTSDHSKTAGGAAAASGFHAAPAGATTTTTTTGSLKHFGSGSIVSQSGSMRGGGGQQQNPAATSTTPHQAPGLLPPGNAHPAPAGIAGAMSLMSPSELPAVPGGAPSLSSSAGLTAAAATTTSNTTGSSGADLTMKNLAQHARTAKREGLPGNLGARQNSFETASMPDSLVIQPSTVVAATLPLPPPANRTDTARETPDASPLAAPSASAPAATNSNSNPNTHSNTPSPPIAVVETGSGSININNRTRSNPGGGGDRLADTSIANSAQHSITHLSNSPSHSEIEGDMLTDAMQRDVFDLGVVLFIMLTGDNPFSDYDDASDVVNLPSFGSKIESLPARQLVKSMINFDSSKQYTLGDVCHHPWFMTDLKDDKELFPNGLPKASGLPGADFNEIAYFEAMENAERPSGSPTLRRQNSGFERYGSFSGGGAGAAVSANNNPSASGGEMDHRSGGGGAGGTIQRGRSFTRQPQPQHADVDTSTTGMNSAHESGTVTPRGGGGGGGGGLGGTASGEQSLLRERADSILSAGGMVERCRSFLDFSHLVNVGDAADATNIESIRTGVSGGASAGSFVGAGGGTVGGAAGGGGVAGGSGGAASIPSGSIVGSIPLDGTLNATDQSTTEERAVIKEAFDAIDLDHHGYIGMDQLRDVIIALKGGENVAKEDVAGIYNELLSPSRRSRTGSHARAHHHSVGGSGGGGIIIGGGGGVGGGSGTGSGVGDNSSTTHHHDGGEHDFMERSFSKGGLHNAGGSSEASGSPQQQLSEKEHSIPHSLQGEISMDGSVASTSHGRTHHHQQHHHPHQHQHPQHHIVHSGDEFGAGGNSPDENISERQFLDYWVLRDGAHDQIITDILGPDTFTLQKLKEVQVTTTSGAGGAADAGGVGGGLLVTSGVGVGSSGASAVKPLSSASSLAGGGGGGGVSGGANNAGGSGGAGSGASSGQPLRDPIAIAQLRKAFDLLDRSHVGTFGAHDLREVLDLQQRQIQLHIDPTMGASSGESSGAGTPAPPTAAPITNDDIDRLASSLASKFHNGEQVCFYDFVSAVLDEEVLTTNVLGSALAAATGLSKIENSHAIQALQRLGGVTLAGTPQEVFDHIQRANPNKMRCMVVTETPATPLPGSSNAGTPAGYPGQSPFQTPGSLHLVPPLPSTGGSLSSFAREHGSGVFGGQQYHGAEMKLLCRYSKHGPPAPFPETSESPIVVGTPASLSHSMMNEHHPNSSGGLSRVASGVSSTAAPGTPANAPPKSPPNEMVASPASLPPATSTSESRFPVTDVRKGSIHAGTGGAGGGSHHLKSKDEAALRLKKLRSGAAADSGPATPGTAAAGTIDIKITLKQADCSVMTSMRLQPVGGTGGSTNRLYLEAVQAIRDSTQGLRQQALKWSRPTGESLLL